MRWSRNASPRLLRSRSGRSLAVFVAAVVFCLLFGTSATASPGRVVSLSITPQSSPPNEGGVIASLDLAQAAGMRGNFLSATWAALEPSPGVYRLNDLAGALPYLGDTRGLTQLVTLSVVNTTVRETPADLAGHSFSSPVLRRRFRAFLDALLPHLLAGRVTYLSLGNEVDIYLALHPGDMAAYKSFYADAVAYLHQVAPSIKVGVTATFDGAADWLRSDVAALNAVSDVVVLTYYPVGDNFIPRPANAPLTDFPRMTVLAAGRPVIVQEVGYPSSPTVSSSEQAQAQFVTNLFTAWSAAGAAIPLVNIFAMHDLSPDLCVSLEQYYKVVLGPNFIPYLCSLGLRGADGRAKPAWTAFATGAAALTASP